MKLIKCDNNHYYNQDKFNSCPQCAFAESKGRDLETTGFNQEKIPTLPPESDNATQGRKPVGWLMCIKGVMQYKSFVIMEGTNHIGRDSGMDVSLLKEPTVSRERHATIICDTATSSFFVEAGNNSSTPVYHNETILKKRTAFSAHDRLTLGDCTLLFIPLCGEQFNWNNI